MLLQELRRYLLLSDEMNRAMRVVVKKRKRMYLTRRQTRYHPFACAQAHLFIDCRFVYVLRYVLAILGMCSGSTCTKNARHGMESRGSLARQTHRTMERSVSWLWILYLCISKYSVEGAEAIAWKHLP